MKHGLKLMVAFALAMGCGDDDGGTTPDMATGADMATGTDMATGEDMAAGEDMAVAETGAPACPDLGPTQGADNLVISQYDLATGEIEFFNPTGAAIPLDGLVLCSRPVYEVISGSGVSVPAGGYAVFTADGGFRGADGDGGELALYDSTSYNSRAAMIDFVCWGTGRASSRQSVANEELGSEVLWDGDDCGGSVSGGAVRRSTGSAGTTPGDYDFSSAFAATACE
ncbi:MAG: hypothetical protein AAF411_13300 [Myxococcota bacterium]